MFRHAWLQWWIAFDQMVNATLSLVLPWAWRGVWADETLSCRAYRAWKDGKRMGLIMMPVIDRLFAWQELPQGAIGHCHGAYIKERTKYNLPPEMR